MRVSHNTFQLYRNYGGSANYGVTATRGGEPTATREKPTATRRKVTATRGKVTATRGETHRHAGKPTATRGKPTATRGETHRHARGNPPPRAGKSPPRAGKPTATRRNPPPRAETYRHAQKTTNPENFPLKFILPPSSSYIRKNKEMKHRGQYERKRTGSAGAV